MSPLQLRSAAAALSPGEGKAESSEELDGSNGPTEGAGDERGASGEQRAQALRALLLARKRKNPTKDSGVPASVFFFTEQNSTSFYVLDERSILILFCEKQNNLTIKLSFIE